MTRRMWGLAGVAGAALGLVLSGGCSGGGGGGGGGGGPLRGELSLSVVKVGSTLNGQALGLFFKGIDVSGSFSAPGIDQCFTPTPAPTATTSPTPGPTPQPLDLGATITLSSGATTISMTGGNFGGIQAYQPSGALPSPLPLNAAWDFANAGGVDVPAGSITGALHMPDMIALSTSNLTLTTSPTVTWTPANSQYVTITFQDQSAATVLTCIAHDDGSFDIPSTLPSGSGAGTINALNEDTHPMADGVAWFIGSTQASFTWTK